MLFLGLLRDECPPFSLEDGETGPMGGWASMRMFPGDTLRPDVCPGRPAVPPSPPPSG